MKVWRVLKGSNYKHFKISISQQLHAGDLERRMNFCVWLHDQLNLDPGFLNCILFGQTTPNLRIVEFSRGITNTLEH